MIERGADCEGCIILHSGKSAMGRYSGGIYKRELGAIQIRNPTNLDRRLRI
jgi:hypothetical protein